MIAVILPAHYMLRAPVSIAAFILFLVTLILGTFLAIGIAMLIYVIMFYTTSSKGLFNVYSVIAEFFAGSVVPIPFMPEWLQNVCYALPFRLSIDLPYRVYTGNIPINEAIISVIIQLIWLTIIVIVGNFLINNAAKKLVIQGG